MLSEDRKIKSRAQLREYLEADCARYPMSGRRILPYLLQISEGAILRRHIVLLRKTEMACAMAQALLGREYPARRIGGLWKKLLIDDKLRSELSSEDLASYMGKVLKRLSSVIPEGG